MSDRLNYVEIQAAIRLHAQAADDYASGRLSHWNNMQNFGPDRDRDCVQANLATTLMHAAAAKALSLI